MERKQIQDKKHTFNKRKRDGGSKNRPQKHQKNNSGGANSVKLSFEDEFS